MPNLKKQTGAVSCGIAGYSPRLSNRISFLSYAFVVGASASGMAILRSRIPYIRCLSTEPTHCPTTTHATALPIMFVSALQVAMNQSTPSYITDPTTEEYLGADANSFI